MNHACWGGPLGGDLESLLQSVLSRQLKLPPRLGSTHYTTRFGPVALFLVPHPISLRLPHKISPTHKPPHRTLLPLGLGNKSLLQQPLSSGRPLLQKYVQDVLQEQLAEPVYRALKEQGGHIYVCGDVTMAADVLKAIQRIMTQQGKLSEEDAGVFISRLRVSDSWHPGAGSFPLAQSVPSQLGLYPAIAQRGCTARHAGTYTQSIWF